VLWHKHLSGFGKQNSSACQLGKTWNHKAIKNDISNGKVNSVFQMHFLEDRRTRGFIYCKWRWLEISLCLPYTLINFNLLCVISYKWIKPSKGAQSKFCAAVAFTVYTQIIETDSFLYSSIQHNVWLQPECSLLVLYVVRNISLVAVWGCFWLPKPFSNFAELISAQLSENASSWINRSHSHTGTKKTTLL